MTRDFTYAEVGATGELPLPPGYHHVQLREHVGRGAATFAAVARSVMSWEVHRGSGLIVRASAERAAPGVEVTCGAGAGPVRLWFPCRVVWTVEEDHRAGFAYGTLPGHPEAGEEAFVTEIDDAGDVWFAVTAFSRPGRWYTRLAGPLNRTVQHGAIRRYVRSARRLGAAR
ncbi:DUF1990 family protein [Phytoactinopolyspora limicola]|uniref:DUF1990 family protein n=1 Tax=Phytoactinopolyspora limicola TaxID=2715536 RepID=UPI00140936E1|nr:DUF1990 domain-containing protein [Phytoactinopolyspora limicola]